MHFNLEELIRQAGYFGMFLIIFAESGLFFGFFLPGDSLLFTAGFLASQGYFDIALLLGLLSVAAVSGDSVGYWFGNKTGKKIFSRDDSFFLNKKHLASAQAFYEKHGGKTIIMARFIPAVRTFAPIVAGAAEMTYKHFLMYNVVGGLLWVCGLGFGGYFLGRSIPNVDRYLLPIIALIVFVSVLPGLIHFLQDKETREDLKNTGLKVWNKLWNKQQASDKNA